MQSTFAYAVLILLAFPIFYMLGAKPLNYVETLNVWIVYCAVFAAGPCLLLYAFIARTKMQEKTVSSISLMVGGLWMGFEIILAIKDALFG